MTEDREKRRKREIIFRLVTVLLMALLASGVPHLAEFMSFTGAVTGYPLAVIYPCVIDLLVRCFRGLERGGERERERVA